jgi:hypothetical protein
MKYFKLKYNNGNIEIKKAKTIIDLIKRYDLATRKNINTRIFELEGEQLAIAISNDNL